MTSLIDKMRSARNDASVILMRYNQRRSSRPGRVFLAVEGTEDIAFYETMIKRVLGDNLAELYFFVCNGKDNVLDLLQSLNENVSSDSDRVAYFIDSDFDGRKGVASHPRLYMTDTYSIENHLATRDVLSALLSSEFRCSVEDEDKDAEAALSAYDKFMESYKQQFEAINTCIFISRKSDKYCVNTQRSIENKSKITLNGIEFQGNELSGSISILGIEKTRSEIEAFFTEETVRISEFRALDPIRNWRGKYVYYLFVKFLKLLAEDRGRRKERVVFPNRAAISFEPNEGAVRLFTSVATIPACLRVFLLDNAMFATTPTPSV